MSRFLASFTLIAFITCAASTSADDKGPSDKIPELKALDHYAGSWDVAVTAPGATAFEKGTKGQATARWILDGRFLQQTGAWQAKDGSTGHQIMTLMTYDSAKKVYRSWTFHSDGSTVESDATWDAKARTMTSVSRKHESGGTFTTTADFSEADVEVWKIVYADQTGKVVSEFTGKNTRQKK